MEYAIRLYVPTLLALTTGLRRGEVLALPDDKTTVVSFVLSEGRCADLGRVLVNKFPSCTSRTGEKVDGDP